MAVIRFPECGEGLLELCRASNKPGFQPVFDTYAHLITFAACFGYYLMEVDGKKLPEKIKFIKNPSPVELGIFRNNQLYPQLLTIALAHSESHSMATNDDALSELMERFAALGMAHMLGQDLAKLMLSAPFAFERAELQI